GAPCHIANRSPERVRAVLGGGLGLNERFRRFLFYSVGRGERKSETRSRARNTRSGCSSQPSHLGRCEVRKMDLATLAPRGATSGKLAFAQGAAGLSMSTKGALVSPRRVR